MYTEERITQLDPHRRYPFLGALVYAMMIEMIKLKEMTMEMIKQKNYDGDDDLQILLVLKGSSYGD